MPNHDYIMVNGRRRLLRHARWFPLTHPAPSVSPTDNTASESPASTEADTSLSSSSAGNVNNSNTDAATIVAQGMGSTPTFNALATFPPVPTDSSRQLPLLADLCHDSPNMTTPSWLDPGFEYFSEPAMELGCQTCPQASDYLDLDADTASDALVAVSINQEVHCAVHDCVFFALAAEAEEEVKEVNKSLGTAGVPCLPPALPVRTIEPRCSEVDAWANWGRGGRDAMSEEQLSCLGWAEREGRTKKRKKIKGRGGD